MITTCNSIEQFKEGIKKELLIVDFFATWCGPCKMMEPIFEELVNDLKDLEVLKVDVDKYNELAREYQVMSIPTIIVFKNGNVVDSKVGYMPKELLVKWVETLK